MKDANNGNPIHLPQKQPKAGIMQVHSGKTFLDVANTYPYLVLAIGEGVQNAIDAGAKLITVTVSQRTRFISLRDNGCGRTIEEFNGALASINQTLKKGDKLGQFGKGLISFLGKCKHFTFTSCSEATGNTEYNEWTFVSDDIVSSYAPPVVPIRRRKDLYFGAKLPSGYSIKATPVSWRTELAIYSYNTVDKQMSKLTLDEIERSILSRYAVAIRNKKVLIQISFTDEMGETSVRTVKADHYRGVAITRVELNDSDAGNVAFRLFRVKKGIQGLGVVIREDGNDFTLPWANFYNQTRAPGSGLHITRGVNELLSSGAFEGEIIVEHIDVHPERTKFVVNDHFMASSLPSKNGTRRLVTGSTGTCVRCKMRINFAKRHSSLLSG